MQIDEHGRKHFAFNDADGDKQGEIIVQEAEDGTAETVTIRFDRLSAALSSTHRNVLLASSGGNITLPSTKDPLHGQPLVLGLNLMAAVPVSEYDEVALAALESAKAKRAMNGNVRQSRIA
jgi:hypothetical protein